MWRPKDSSVIYRGFECTIWRLRPRVYYVEVKASSVLYGGLRT